MPNEFVFDSRSIMKSSEAARLATKVLKMLMNASKQKVESEALSKNENLKKAVFENGDVKSVLSDMKITTDNKGKSFDDVSVVLVKGYAARDISYAMSRSDVGCIRMVHNDNGMIALLYAKDNENKMQGILKDLETRAGASPVVNAETLQKMASARGNTKLVEVSNLTYADVARFEYASHKFGFNIAISSDETNSFNEDKFKVTAMSTDDKKLKHAIKDVAIGRISTNAEAFNREYVRLADVVNDAAKRALNKESFYICSPTRKNSFIEVNSNGFKVVTQNGDNFKIAKEVEGQVSQSRIFNELGNELTSLENPVILSKEEFSVNIEQRYMEAVGKLDTLTQNSDAKAFVSNVTSKVLDAANQCGYQIYNMSSVNREEFLKRIESSKIEDKEAVYAAVGTLNALPSQMVDSVIRECNEHAKELEEYIATVEELDIQNNDINHNIPETPSEDAPNI